MKARAKSSPATWKSMCMTTKTPDTTDNRRAAIKRARSQASFSLIETVIALAIVSFLILEVAAVQGNSIVFAEYGRNVTQAGWLAKRVMSQVEYYWRSKPFKDLETNIVDQKF